MTALETIINAIVDAVEAAADTLCEALVFASAVEAPIDFGFADLETVMGSQMDRDIARSDRRDARRMGWQA